MAPFESFLTGLNFVAPAGLELWQSSCSSFPRAGLPALATTPCLMFSHLMQTTTLGNICRTVSLRQYIMSSDLCPVTELLRLGFVQCACRCFESSGKGPPAVSLLPKGKTRLIIGECRCGYSVPAYTCSICASLLLCDELGMPDLKLTPSTWGSPTPSPCTNSSWGSRSWS